MINIRGVPIIPGDIKFKHLWYVCNHYHEKCPWALGEEGGCEIEYWDYHLIDISGSKPNCPFKYREQI
ncbi:hypothetical protein LCGC14_1937740 [marine sediment metagenome]|uniref:Uncharacterized protein n=1 Tax=marine sediment metagenome TaxID=412755 RepID=A0A0F9HZQ3_9ZZZZ